MPAHQATGSRLAAILPYRIPQTEEQDGEEFVALPETDWQIEEGLSQGSQGTETFAAMLRQETVPAKSDTWLAPPQADSNETCCW